MTGPRPDDPQLRAEIAVLDEWAAFASRNGRPRAADCFQSIKRRIAGIALVHCDRCATVITRHLSLTPRQVEIYRYIAEHIGRHGYAPSFQEIAERFGFNSLATVHEHLGNLVRKGWIRRRYNESRGIDLVDRDAAWNPGSPWSAVPVSPPERR